MEPDGVPGPGSFGFPDLNHSFVREEQEEEEEKGHEKDKGRAGDDEEERPTGGFISHIISNLVGRDDREEEDVDHGDYKEELGGKGEEKEGGIVSHLISHLVNERKAEANKDGRESVKKVGESGVVIGNLISNLLNHGDGPEDRAEEGGGGGDSNHFPKTLADDDDDDDNRNHVDLATEEASILIHSIVHD